VGPNQGNVADVRTGELALERTAAGPVVLTISGEHDLSTAPNLRRQLDGLLGERAVTVVDLSPATFIDSSILGVILDGRRRASDAGVGFEVVQARGAEAVDRVLEVTGLRTDLPVHESREVAFAAASDNLEASAP
jgi:anti-sigma B factor antagonist